MRWVVSRSKYSLSAWRLIFPQVPNGEEYRGNWLTSTPKIDLP
ncbi:MAG: hypothetical protein WCO29_23755 [Nostocales cyanobacterium ELA583]